MQKLSTIAAVALVLSSGAALAQTGPGGMMPAGPNSAPGGANGAAPVSTIGSPTANAQDTLNGGTRSTSVLSQSNKNQSASGMSRSDYDANAQRRYGAQAQPGSTGQQGYQNQAMGMHRDVSSGTNDDPRAVAITDEYGNRYNSRGERIGHGAPNR
jgi:hypothetical protein